MSLRRFAAAAILAFAALSSADNLEVAASDPVKGTDTVHGCYNSLGELTKNSVQEFNSQGKCATICRTLEKPVAASYSETCYCGDQYPNSKNLVDDSKCNEPCPGYDTQACGGLGTYTVYNTGVQVAVGESEEDISSSSSAGSSSTTSSTTAATSAADQIETVTSTPTSGADSSSGSTNTTGIAVGVVVAVVVVGAAAGGFFWYMRRRRNDEIEEEHRRNQAVNAFISNGKPPSSSGGLSMSDARMDPIMNRRLSDGSIADNQDYSRRILRVTNA
ncbi:hypothetical protein F5Y15DRAFT_115142 [Xylariaceae sp. FL0016]|nr:hypothetical protein F5Y15DRAFT_115142 [Xylariaceae sp. FL0016]